METYDQVTRRLAWYIPDLDRILSVAEVAAHLGLDWKLIKACNKVAFREEFGTIDRSDLRVLAVEEN